MTGGQVAAMVGGLIALTAPASGAHQAARMPAIYPVPHEITMRTGTVRVTGTVTIVAGPKADPAAVALVGQTLASSGAAVRRANATPGNGHNLVVIVGRDRAAERALAVRNAAGLPSGGYVLASGTTRSGPTIVLDGVDAAGEYYAAQTLSELLTHRFSLPAMSIRDWPSLRNRGIVEGFYGPPWSDAERTSAIDFMARHKLNLYMYLPKDDPYVRSAWRTPLPASRLKALGAAAARAKREHVTFTYGISPGDSICYSSPTDRAALIVRFQALARVGIRSFAIALDDIDPTRPLCASDVAAYGTSATALATAQAELVNSVATALRGTIATPLTFVPTEYSGLSATPYQLTLAADVDPGIVIQWTGPYGVSMSITGVDTAAAQQLYAHPLLIWDNYFVNDLLQGYLVLGPYAGRDATLAHTATGIVIDPMSQPEVSRLGLFTAADFAWNATQYNPTRSWAAGLDELSGGDAQARAALKTFAEANYGSPADTTQSPTLAAAMATFWRLWEAGDTSGAAPLAAQFLRLRDAPATIRARLTDTAFVDDAAPWLDATQLWGTSAYAALDLMMARVANDDARATADEATARAARQQATLMTLPGTSPPASVRVAGGLLSEFVHYALRGYGP